VTITTILVARGMEQKGSSSMRLMTAAVGVVSERLSEEVTLFLFLVFLGFELRASNLLGRCCIT
jgi:hypothetical protein